MPQEIRTKQKLRKIIAATKNIIKKSENSNIKRGQNKLSITMIQKKENEFEKDIVKNNSDNFNKQFYPKEPNEEFPRYLQQNIIKIIQSFGISTNFKNIINNLSLFYKNRIDKTILNNYFAYAEENGIIYERQGQYFVSQELISINGIYGCSYPQKKVNLDNQWKIDENEQNQQLISLEKQKILKLEIF